MKGWLRRETEIPRTSVASSARGLLERGRGDSKPV